MIDDQKASLRKQLHKRRRDIRAESHARFSRLAARRLLRQIDLPSSNKVAGFWPLGSEIDTRPLLLALHCLGANVVLPRTYKRAQPLTFHLWAPDTIMETSRFGVQEPPLSANRLEPDLILVPLLGFDTEGYRLGYGAGHYDCTLADLAARDREPVTIGLAFDCQRVDKVPREAHDRRLDGIVTEAAFYQP